ncbi:MAG TPA: DUF5131 family protein [Candidatus Marinimicrobia bacterium]|nr:DUF5131 family protein [Candidatus Neomarinimicrobiota bacterium]
MFDRIEKGLYWDRAWSLVEGCTPASEGCTHCWAARQAAMRMHQKNEKIRKRYEELTDENGHWTGKIRLMEKNLSLPLHIKKPTVFAIWNDLFHEKVPRDFIQYAFEVMEAASQHIFLVLTKRPERIQESLYGEQGNWYLGGGDYIANIWLGVTAENQEQADKRIPVLLQIPTAKRFVSIEPILGPIVLDKWIGEQKLHWVILGGETGPGARPMKYGWAFEIAEQCADAGVPLFYKQGLDDTGNFTKLPVLQGRQWKEIPNGFTVPESY